MDAYRNTSEGHGKATEKLEALIKGDERVVNYTSFIGTAAPRFYYNFAPEFPVTNYSQILINTTDIETTEELAAELAGKIEAVVPERSPSGKTHAAG